MIQNDLTDLETKGACFVLQATRFLDVVSEYTKFKLNRKPVSEPKLCKSRCYADPGPSYTVPRMAAMSATTQATKLQTVVPYTNAAAAEPFNYGHACRQSI